MVLDASIIVKWVKSADEEKVGEARLYFEQLRRKEIEITVPDLIFYELANLASRQSDEAQKIYLELINNLFNSDIKIVPPDQELIREAVNIAYSFKVSAYDAAYLALASRFQTKLVTADSKLCAKVPDLTISL